MQTTYFFFSSHFCQFDINNSYCVYGWTMKIRILNDAFGIWLVEKKIGRQKFKRLFTSSKMIANGRAKKMKVSNLFTFAFVRVFLGFQREPLVSIIGNWCWNSVPFSICLKMAGNWMWKPFSNCKIVTRQRQNMEWNTNDTSAMNHMMAYAHCLHIVYIHIPIHIFWGVQ